MRSLLLAIASFLLVGGSVALAQEPMRFGFYNLENLFDTINDPAVRDSEYLDYDYALKVRRLGTVVESFAPNVLGVCEVENYGVMTTLNEVLGGRYEIVHYDSRDARGIDVALLYDSECLELKSSELIEFEYLYRGVLRADLVVRESSREVTVLVAHLPSQRGGREAKAKRERALCALDSIAQEIGSVVLIGDMNDNPQQMKYLHNYAVEAYSEGLASYVYRDRWSLFDQVMVSPDLKVITQGSQKVVINKELINQRGRFKGYPKRGAPSDHLPIFTDLIL